MEFNFILKGNAAYSWVHYNSCFFLGFIITEEDEILRGKNAIDYIFEQTEAKSLSNVFSKIDGSFSFILKSEEKLVIVSDGVNFFPLFYFQTNGNITVSDRWDDLVEEKGSFKINSAAIAEFETAGFVLGDETLETEIFKTGANQILIFENKNVISKIYRNFTADEFSLKAFEELANESEELLLAAGKRLTKFLNGRTAIVPLSGGFDSRLIVSVLKRLNYKKVICFTYGKMNPEVDISKKVADTLGYEWNFIDYSQINYREIQQTEHYKKYLNFAGNGSSMPYLMEYFAVKILLDRQNIPKDAVFLPGHSGDFLGGSYILKTVKSDINISHLPKHIEQKYFTFKKKNTRESLNIQKRIKNNFQIVESNITQNGYNSPVEEWDIQEKLAKFIFHSSSVFPYFGFENYFLLWDLRLVNFYKNVPYSFRENKKLYDEVAEKFFFKPLDISFGKKELTPSKLTIILQKIKDKIRYFLPWKMVLNRINIADWPYYEKLTENMRCEIVEERGKKFTNFKVYNAVVCAWYVQHIQQRFSSKH